MPTQEADVYALGASWFLSATGWRHVSYPDDADRKDQRQAIVDKPHRPINVPGPLGPLIESMMSRDPLLRPTGTEVCAALHGMLGEGESMAGSPCEHGSHRAGSQNCLTCTNAQEQRRHATAPPSTPPPSAAPPVPERR
ncbi:hypothetical protein [Streptomyces platensis]|uniref:hypothetical protein n=1 Tax=Streptomyces platensis TaxID=58346 RepID=UPI00331FB6A9